MKIKTEVLANGIETIKKTANADLGSPKLNYEFAKLLNSVDTDIKAYLDAKQKAIISCSNIEGDTYRVKPDKIQELNEKLWELSAVESEINWNKQEISLEMLNGFTATDMLFLQEFFYIKEND